MFGLKKKQKQQIEDIAKNSKGSVGSEFQTNTLDCKECDNTCEDMCVNACVGGNEKDLRVSKRR